jgi:hypothetical protein
MKPKPFWVLNHFTVPVAMMSPSLEMIGQTWRGMRQVADGSKLVGK